VRRGVWWGGLVLLLVLAACGSSDNDTDTAEQTATPSTPSVTATATTAAAQPLIGEPPASPETERIEQIFAGTTLPPLVEVFGRRDIPNESVEKDSPEAGARFREYGRVTGNYYVLAVDGAQRMTLSINQYQSPEGATTEFDFGQGSPAPEDRLDTSGLGDNSSANRSTLGDGGSRTSLYLVSFTRGCYYVVVADFPPGGADSPPDSALALARAVDDQLKASPPGEGGAVGCG
jgi:hypothetical protein